MHPIFMHLFCLVWISYENSKQGNRCKFYQEEIKWYSCENLVCYVSKNIYLVSYYTKSFYVQEYFSHEILMLTFYMAQFEVKYDFNSVYYNQQIHWHFWGLYTGTQANIVCDIKNANSWQILLLQEFSSLQFAIQPDSLQKEWSIGKGHQLHWFCTYSARYV